MKKLEYFYTCGGLSQNGEKLEIGFKDSDPNHPLVFIHGFGGNLEVWKYQVPLCSRRRCIFIDLPGHGRLLAPQTECTLDMMADGVIAVLKNLGFLKAVFVGHSNGARVCARIYEKRPDLVSKIVIVDGNLRAPYPSPILPDREAFLEIVEKMKGEDYFPLIQTMTAPMLNGLETEDKIMIEKIMENTPQHVLASTFASMGEGVFKKKTKIGVPVLAIIASLKIFGEDYPEYLKKIAPNIKFYFLQRTGHFLMIERWKQFNDYLYSFIK